MEFIEFKKAFQKNFETKTSDINHLFTVDIDPDELWNRYLDSFPPGTNEILRVRREFDCSACRRFVKQFGNVVILKDNRLDTIWNFTINDPTYQHVISAVHDFIKSTGNVNGVYITREAKIGVDKNLEQADDGTVHEWHHLFMDLPARFVYRGSDTLDTVRGNYTAIRDVFARSLSELSLDSVDIVLDLINSNTLYKGEEWKGVLQQFRKYKVEFDSVKNTGLFTWEKSVEAGPVIGKIRNHSIGTLLIDITAGMELDEAVRRYEKVVAPTNYKRPKAIFTKQMLEDAKKTIEDLGYMASLSRRFATLDDITVNNILFSNRDATKRITGNDIFDELESTITVDPKKFSKVEEVSITTFINDILPTTREVEILFENKLAPNMVSLIAPGKPDAKTMFKWNNGFSWAYSGNITDSVMKENVKLAGGNVNGVLRFSIQWNDGKTPDHNDLDAHCIEPGGNEISFMRKSGHASSGSLDVDIIHPEPGYPAVENIVYTDMHRMKPGQYKFFVRQFNNRGGRDGFNAEIEFDGQIFEFSYPRELRQNEDVPVATVTFDGSKFTIVEHIPAQQSSKEVWSLHTSQFVPASVIMYSPNYWDEQDGIGHRHVFFMLKDCKNPENPSGYFNEYLKQDLEKHKRIFEVLGSKSGVVDIDGQLSGIGFSTTKRASVTVKVTGVTERLFKINF